MNFLWHSLDDCDLDHNAYFTRHLLPCSNLSDFSLRLFSRYSPRNRERLTVQRIFIRWATESARDTDIQLIYSGSYCGCIAENGPTRESRANGATPKSDSSSGAPARRSLYKFHESFEPYIFSLSSRFARHVLLKYDNFTRVGRPPALAGLLFLPRLAVPCQILSCFCLQYFCSNSTHFYILRVLLLLFIILLMQLCMLILLLTCEVFSHRC